MIEFRIARTEQTEHGSVPIYELVEYISEDEWDSWCWYFCKNGSASLEDHTGKQRAKILEDGSFSAQKQGSLLKGKPRNPNRLQESVNTIENYFLAFTNSVDIDK